MNIVKPTTSIQRGNRVRRERGAAAVEFAIVISLLVLITGGIIEFGRVFWYLDALTKATRDGARYLSTSALPLDTGKAEGLVVNAATQAGLPGFVAGNGNVTVSCESVSNPGNPCDAPDYVKVEITGYSVTFGSWFAIPLPGGDWLLRPHTTMRYMCTESGKPC